MRTHTILCVVGLGAALPTDTSHQPPDSHRELSVSRRELLSFSRTYCYVNEDGSLRPDRLPIGCTEEPVTAPACTVDSTALCALTGSVNGVDQDRWTASYQFDHCAQTTVYVRGEGNCGDTDTRCAYYCERLDSTGDWSGRRRPSGRAESKSRPWYGCWGGYETRNGRCRDQTRYLGEECWDDTGECFNDGVDPYEGRRLSCATAASAGVEGSPTCIPAAFKVEERNECTCNWFDWHFFFACGASQCNGHPCVLSTGDGKRYCDYQQDNNW